MEKLEERNIFFLKRNKIDNQGQGRGIPFLYNIEQKNLVTQSTRLDVKIVILEEKKLVFEFKLKNSVEFEIVFGHAFYLKKCYYFVSEERDISENFEKSGQNYFFG